MMAALKDFEINQGKTFLQTLRWGAPPYIYKAITGITQGAPARITCTGHGIPDGWSVAVVSVRGMTQINASATPPKGKDYHRATVVDVNTVELNDVNSAEFKPYTAGGYLQMLTPVDLAGYTARMSIKDKIGGVELLRLDTTNSRIVLDNTAKTITLAIDAVTTAAITWKKGVYDLELVSAGGEVVGLLSGTVSAVQEVTT